MFRLEEITKIAHFYLNPVIREGDLTVDATAGNGHDTLFLAKKVGPAGHVYAFDIQAEALRATRSRLKEHNLLNRVTLVASGHEYLDRFLPEPVQAVIYNLGYRPGGERSIVTRLSTTLKSFNLALKVVKPGGLVAVVMYPGHEQGKLEKEGLLVACQGLLNSTYSAACYRLLNCQKQPPELLLVQRKATHQSPPA